MSGRARDHPTVVFYGDSIVTGWRGTTHPRARWSSLVSDELGWREVNLAIDGMGYYRRRGPRDTTGERTPSATDTTLLDAAIRLEPDAVVVCLAANDIGFVSEHSPDVRAAIDRDLSRLAAELPGRPTVVVTYFPTSELSERAAHLDSWIAGAARQYGHTYVEEFRAAASGLGLRCEDGIHPNDDGHRSLADAILPTLRALDLNRSRASG